MDTVFSLVFPYSAIMTSFHLTQGSYVAPGILRLSKVSDLLSDMQLVRSRLYI